MNLSAAHANTPSKIIGSVQPEDLCGAPGVRLVGEQRDGGFRERQWLVQRDGRFIQVSELLYRILERLNGGESLSAIAAGVSEATPWAVTEENVRELIESKLIPAGLIATRSGNLLTPNNQSRVRSPLAVSARRMLVGPRVLQPVTRRLRFLYAPWVLVPAIVAVVTTHVWLYFVHGIAGPIRDVLLHPALVVPATAIFAATAVFHELGHATALRYGGGEARGIGVGIYLIYPVFFTDTSDAYRLGRWARVRVDLGGFYFQLLAAVALMDIAALTRQTWLLFPVLVINLETARQLLIPFVRLDGYWLFADLTGIPDLFSQAIPFMRSVLPGSRRGRSGMSALKGSTKRVFLGYLLATIPFLGFLTFEFITKAPGFLLTAWRSFRALKGTFAHAIAIGDISHAAASLAQVLILVLPAVATVVLSVVTIAWLGSTVSRHRRLARHGGAI